MTDFAAMYALACGRHGGPEKIKRRLPELVSADVLRSRSDSWYLSVLTRRTFRAGLNHAWVDKQWPHFEKTFFGFDPDKLVLMPDEMFDERMEDPKLIRHHGKMHAIRINAQLVRELRAEYGSMGEFLAQWPATDGVKLWEVFRKRGKHLGGRSAPAFLRMVGWDAWMPTTHVLAGLVARDIVPKALTSMRDRQAAQDAFNHWSAESGWPIAHVSQLLAMTIG